MQRKDETLKRRNPKRKKGNWEGREVIGKGEKVKGKRKVKAVVTNCGFDHFKLKPWLVTTVSKHFRKIKP